MLFSQLLFKCPTCGATIRQRMEDGEQLTCGTCRGLFAVMQDEASGKTGLIDVSERRIPEPL